MQSFSDHILRLFEELHPLDRVARAGYVLRGVAEPESVAAHSHFVALLALLFAERYPDRFDESTVVAMALIHDVAECRLMDIPMPAVDAHFKALKAEAEQTVTEQLFAGISDRYGELHRALTEAVTPEARLVRGLDKAQMMIKVLMYEREGRGRLEEFWVNPANFNDYGLTCVSEMFDAICTEAGRTRPR